MKPLKFNYYDYKYENIRLSVNFSNGSVYEFINVPKAISNG